MKLDSKYLMSKRGLDLLHKLFHSSGEGIMIFNKQGEIDMLNPRAVDMFGYAESQLVGQKVEMLIPKTSRSSHVKQREEYAKEPMPRKMGEGRDLEGLRKDGSTFPLEVSLSYIQHEDQHMIVAFITDITIRKQNEKKLEEQREKLKEYTTELEKKVKSRTSELEHMNLGLQSQIQERKLAEEALQNSLEDLKHAEKEILNSLQKEKELGELKSRFVSMASHEFRTPLTTILSSANLISKYTQQDQQEPREKHIDRIRKSVQNLTAILNDFLSLEKLESGIERIENVTCEIGDLIKEAKEEISPILKVGQEIKLEVEDIPILTDPHILKNVLINLLSNASKYSSESDPIEINASKNDKYYSIEIRDHGIGIPEDEQKNMFERFFRAKNVTNIQGTGLGLNIVNKYIELLKGSVSFKSKEGEGSSFYLKLPLN